MSLETSEDSTSNVVVAVRLRPPEDGSHDLGEVAQTTSTTLTLRDPLSRGVHEHSFDFSRVFLPQHGQELVFEKLARPLVDNLLKGFNNCCFAYGQTGSGKTHSVFGEGNAEDRGMLARSIEYLFERIEDMSTTKEIGMAVSFTEIYLDQVRDLGAFYVEQRRRGGPRHRGASSTFADSAVHGYGEAEVARTAAAICMQVRPASASSSNSRPQQGAERPGSAASSQGPDDAAVHRSGSAKPRSGSVRRPSSGHRPSQVEKASSGASGDVADSYLTQNLPVHESRQGHVYAEGLALIPVSNIQEVLEVANLGVKMRATYETRLNPRSSRSHTIFTISVAQRSKTAKGGILASAINFVDLAGSERMARSQSEGKRFQEAVIINSSLSTLGKVVLALATNSRGHVPFRDSKLTRLLQNSLGGNSFTSLLVTIDPSPRNYSESLNSLLFADRCKFVRNMPRQGAIPESEQRIVQRLMAEIAELQKKLDMHAAAAAPPDPLQDSKAIGGDEQAKPKKNSELASEAAARLKLEEVQTKEVEKMVDLAARKLEQAVQENFARDMERRSQISALKKQSRDLESEIALLRNKLSHIATAVASGKHSELQARMTYVEQLRQDREDVLRQVPREVTEGLLGAQGALERTLEEQAAVHCGRNAQVAQAFVASHDCDRALLERQNQQWLESKRSDGGRILSEIQELRVRSQEQSHVLHGDLLAAHEVAVGLGKLVDTLREGAAPKQQARLSLPAQLADLVRSKRETGKRVSRETPLEQLRAGIAGLRRQLVLHSQQALPGKDDTQGKGAMDPASGGGWEADRFARHFCEAAGADSSQEEALASLSNLSADRLRSLCLALWARAKMSAATQELERSRLQEEVVQELQSHGRVGQIRQLEKEIADCKARFASEEERGQRLGSALSCHGPEQCAKAQLGKASSPRQIARPERHRA